VLHDTAAVDEADSQSAFQGGDSAPSPRPRSVGDSQSAQLMALLNGGQRESLWSAVLYECDLGFPEHHGNFLCFVPSH
jgi:hypothetical protein